MAMPDPAWILGWVAISLATREIAIELAAHVLLGHSYRPRRFRRIDLLLWAGIVPLSMGLFALHQGVVSAGVVGGALILAIAVRPTIAVMLGFEEPRP